MPLDAEALAAVGRREAMRLAGERRRAAQARIERAVGRAGVPRRFRDKTFDGYRATTPAQRHALAVCRSYAERFTEVKARGSCLLLMGGPGTGKTHLACAILGSLIRAGHSGLFISVSAALRWVREAYAPQARRTEGEAFALLTAPTLLVLDEVGVAIGNEAKRRAMLFDILDTRYAEMRPTVLIGNLTADELAVYLGERTLDRLQEIGSATVAFDWPSHRQGPADV